MGTQGLLAREGEQLAGQPRRAVSVVADLLDVVIVAVAGRMAHQDQVAMAEHRRQDIVEIMRHAAGELAHRLHLCGLRHLPLEAPFLGAVLEAEQHRRLAQPARGRDGERDRLLRTVAQPHRDVARQQRPMADRSGGRLRRCEPPHRVRHRGLVLLDHQIARIDGPLGLGHAGGAQEGLVLEEEASIAVDQREAERQHPQQAIEIGRARGADAIVRSNGLIEQQHRRGTGGEFAIVERNVEQPQRIDGFLIARKAQRPLGVLHQAGCKVAPGAAHHLAAGRAEREHLVGDHDPATLVYQRGHQPGTPQPLTEIATDQAQGIRAPLAASITDPPK